MATTLSNPGGTFVSREKLAPQASTDPLFLNARRANVPPAIVTILVNPAGVRWSPHCATVPSFLKTML